MFAKPISFLLIFILSIANVFFVMLPLVVVMWPAIIYFDGFFSQVGMDGVYAFISVVSILMLLYLLADYIFSLTTKRVLKSTVPFEYAAALDGNEEIVGMFNWIKKRFGQNSAKLLLDESMDQINAFAVGSFRHKYVVLTMGLMMHFYNKANNRDEYLNAVNGVLGHELSHLANKDWLIGLLAYANESATYFVGAIFRRIFMSLAWLLNFIPLIGFLLSTIIIKLHNILFFFINMFYRFIFLPVYCWLQKFTSRSMEYRCDRDSAYAIGGKRMTAALTMLDGANYFSLFSTHPAIKSRVKKASKINVQGGEVKVSIINNVSNTIAVAMVVFICVFTSYKTNTEKLYYLYKSEIYYTLKGDIGHIRPFSWLF